MKRVFSSQSEVFHRWANQTQSDAVAGNVRFEGAKLYSYRTCISDFIVMDLDPERAPEGLVWAGDPSLAWGDDTPCVGFVGDRYHRPFRIVGEHLPYKGSVLAIDPSGRGNDEMGYAVVKQLNGYLFIAEAGGLQGGYSPDNLQWLSELAKRHSVNHVIVESNFGDGMFTELLKPVMARIHKCAIEEVRHSTQKERRIIDTIEPVLSSHRLVVDPKVIRKDYESVQSYPGESRVNYLLFHQLSRITRDRGALRHDDRVDALSIAINYWVQHLAQDATKKQDERKAALLKDELKKFMENALGRQKTRSGWLRN